MEARSLRALPSLPFPLLAPKGRIERTKVSQPHVDASLTQAAAAVRHKSPTPDASLPALLADRFGIEEARIYAIAGINPRAVARRKSRALSAHESDRLQRIARLCAEANRVFADLNRARDWMTRYHPVLDAIPLVVLATDAGAADVNDELCRIEHGDFV
ncbi:MAG: antitoxin Xre/MbcA/ParS toxin-binding domain-containing protein [Pseudomarimonas sp.]